MLQGINKFLITPVDILTKVLKPVYAVVGLFDLGFSNLSLKYIALVYFDALVFLYSSV